jgi:hypothetical protein
MFIAWLLEQSDRPDRVGRFAKLIEADINNACLSRKSKATDIPKHFIAKHPRSYAAMLAELSCSFKEYAELTENYKGL